MKHPSDFTTIGLVSMRIRTMRLGHGRGRAPAWWRGGGVVVPRSRRLRLPLGSLGTRLI